MATKRGPLETGDFGEIGEIGGFGENARGLAIMTINVPTPWRLAILAKMAILAKLAILAKIARGLAIFRMWQIFNLDAKSGPFKLDNLRGSYNCEAALLKKSSNYMPNKRPQ